MNSISLWVLLLLVLALVQPISSKTKNKNFEALENNSTHSFMLTKYFEPEQFEIEISCKFITLIDFQLSNRLRRLHQNIFLNTEIQLNECVRASHDGRRVFVYEDHWELQIENICCQGKNKTKVFKEKLKVIVRDGFSLVGLSVETKTWNIVMPILISLSVCVFVWFSDFSQPRPMNVSVLQRFYHDLKKNKNEAG